MRKTIKEIRKARHSKERNLSTPKKILKGTPIPHFSAQWLEDAWNNRKKDK